MEANLTSGRPTITFAKHAVNETAHVKLAKEIAGEIGELNNPHVVNFALRLIEDSEQFSRKSQKPSHSSGFGNFRPAGN